MCILLSKYTILNIKNKTMMLYFKSTCASTKYMLHVIGCNKLRQFKKKIDMFSCKAFALVCLFDFTLNE